MAESRGLGRGLGALLGTELKVSPSRGGGTLPIALMQPGAFQPRREIHRAALQELAASIRANGVIQPIVVRPLKTSVAGAAQYEIVAGERRWQAAQLAGLTDIPTMVRELTDGRWALPGGWADVNQTASECVVREIEEESGFTARAVKLAAVWDRRRQGHTPPAPFYVYKLFFLCELTGGAARPSVETSEVAFFAEDELPELSVGRIQAHQLRRMFAHYRQPDLPTEFD